MVELNEDDPCVCLQIWLGEQWQSLRRSSVSNMRTRCTASWRLCSPQPTKLKQRWERLWLCCSLQTSHKCSETLKNPLKHHRTAGNMGFFCVGLSRAAPEKLFCNFILFVPLYSFVNWDFIYLIVVNMWEETCICQIRWPITFTVRRLSQGRHRVGA